MTRLLDITRDSCPNTTLKVEMALARLAPGEELQVVVKEEAIRNVFTSLKTNGHWIASVGRREDFFLLLVERGCANAGGATAREHSSCQ